MDRVQLPADTVGHCPPLGVGQLGIHAGRVDASVAELLLHLTQRNSLAHLIDPGTVAKSRPLGGRSLSSSRMDL